MRPFYPQTSFICFEIKKKKAKAFSLNCFWQVFIYFAAPIPRQFIRFIGPAVLLTLQVYPGIEVYLPVKERRNRLLGTFPLLNIYFPHFHYCSIPETHTWICFSHITYWINQRLVSSALHHSPLTLHECISLLSSSTTVYYICYSLCFSWNKHHRNPNISAAWHCFNYIWRETLIFMNKYESPEIKNKWKKPKTIKYSNIEIYTNQSPTQNNWRVKWITLLI